MKKIFFRMLPVIATGVVLTACNNAEEVKKQTDEQNTKIQSLVDAKLGELQTQADQECTALVDSLAQAQYGEWYAKEGKKKGVKPAPKPKPKAEEPKKDNKGTVTDRKNTQENIEENKVTDRKSTPEQNKNNKVTDRKSINKPNN